MINNHKFIVLHYDVRFATYSSNRMVIWASSRMDKADIWVGFCFNLYGKCELKYICEFGYKEINLPENWDCI